MAAENCVVRWYADPLSKRKASTLAAPDYRIAIAIAAVLIYLPYAIFPSASFLSTYPVASQIQHLGFSVLLVMLMFAAGHTGYHLLWPQPLSPRIANWRLAHIVGQSVLVVSIAAHVVLVAISGMVFQETSILRFVAARQSLPFDGFGIILRVYMLAAPIYIISCRILNKSPYVIVIILGLLMVCRAIILSERMALAEYIICCGLPMIHARFLHASVKRITIALVIFMLLLITILQARLVEQTGITTDAWGHASMPEAIWLTVAYYADTMNKFYASIAGKAAYVGSYTITAIQKVTGNSDNDRAFLTYLTQLQEMGISHRAMTNAGGLNEDWTDLGLLALFVLSCKFWLFGRMYKSFKSARLSGLMFYPIAYFAVVEYPRYNYFLMPYAMALLVGGILVWAVALVVSGRTRTSGERPWASADHVRQGRSGI